MPSLSFEIFSPLSQVAKNGLPMKDGELIPLGNNNSILILLQSEIPNSTTGYKTNQFPVNYQSQTCQNNPLVDKIVLFFIQKVFE